jgi:Polyketide cyclase / dehydrase and lipid transport
MAWEFVHAVDCPVSREFAWRFWSNVENWLLDTSAESVTLEGPFAAGTRGTTKPRGLDPLNWQLTEVDEGHNAVIEIDLPGAVARFRWEFAELSNMVTRITQRVAIEGERAEDYMAGAAELEKGIPEGMQMLAAEIVKAAPAS